MTDSTFKPSMTLRYDVEINMPVPVCNQPRTREDIITEWELHDSFDTFEKAEQEILKVLNSRAYHPFPYYEFNSTDLRISARLLDNRLDSDSTRLYRRYGGHDNWDWYPLTVVLNRKNKKGYADLICLLGNDR